MVAGSDKGGVRRGDLFNGVYAMGQMTEDRMNYTGDRVVEILPAGEQAMTLAWTPVIGSVKVMDMAGKEVDFKLVDAEELTYYWDKRLNPNHYDEDGVYQGALAQPDREIELAAYDADPNEDSFGWRGGYGTKAAGKKAGGEAKKAILLQDVAKESLKVAYIYELNVA